MHWNQGCFEVFFTPLLLHRAVLGCGGATAASRSSSWLGWRMFVFSSCWLPPCGWCPTLGRFPLLRCWRAPQSFSTWPGLEHRRTSGLWLVLSVHLAARDINTLLDYHNRVRSQVFPPAANMELMVRKHCAVKWTNSNKGPKTFTLL